MYTYTPTHKFLILSPIHSGPVNGQDESNKSTQVRERSSSQSSTASTGSQLPLPKGFLYLGHE
ncbi:hypothetical protein BDV28DRAFT_161201 [Aspergillus coremiiformis]|uniref:Uncharacterized protein n=1 Tax=Aspergillus coremiiformis TaxID=138285 RepID=A0A5N6YSZ7_9EURO|nr:hypothetical protein BDV28DRAFT_161201 [Aspergillus coremiiformis]